MYNKTTLGVSSKRKIFCVSDLNIVFLDVLFMLETPPPSSVVHIG